MAGVGWSPGDTGKESTCVSPLLISGRPFHLWPCSRLTALQRGGVAPVCCLRVNRSTRGSPSSRGHRVPSSRKGPRARPSFWDQGPSEVRCTLPGVFTVSRSLLGV